MTSPFERPGITGLGIIFALLMAGLPAFAKAQEAGSIFEEVDLTVELAFEPRLFIDDPAFTRQFNGLQLSGFIEPELYWESEDGVTQAAFTPFFRFDARDDERTHFDLREAYVRHSADDWDLLFGANQVFWGVTESRHLVNIVNQIDAVEDIDEEDFLGQPMLQISRQTDFGWFDLFLMTGFRERTFAGRDGRLRGPLVVDGDRAQYESGLEEWRPDIALRYSHVLGDVDVGVHGFHGTGREPDLLVSADRTELIPRYSIITQAGIDLQYTSDAWLWKLEGLAREGQGSSFAAAVAGVEYTYFQVLDSDADLGLIAEGLYDGRDDGPGSRVFPTTLDQDVFLGTRLTLNDTQDTSVLAGFIFDVEDGPASLRLEAERRIGENWKVEVEATAFLEKNRSNPASAFSEDSFLTLRLSRFF